MRRDIEAMSARSESESGYDLVVIGGGITGASIAWDASLRGLKVALLEKADFAHATTSASSKLVHGGLRYLANGDVRVVRESLRERRIWENIAPHMVHPLPFILPTYGYGARGGPFLGLGLFLYDLLSYDRNFLSDDDKKIPAYRSISRERALELMPSLRKQGLTGAKIYYDCQMFAPERLCLEFIQGAVEYGADVANDAEVTSFEMRKDSREPAVTGVHVTDRQTGRTHLIRGKIVVNAAGPWADWVMGRAAEGKPSRRLVRSKGIHIITRAFSGNNALLIPSELGGHFFVIPWRDHTLIGTTDTVFEGDPDSVDVTEKDIADFLIVVNDGLPGLNLTRADVLHFYAGIRPLLEKAKEGGGKDSYNLSREAEVCDHLKLDGIEGFISAIGGKWTTSRSLAEDVVDLALKKLHRSAKCETHCTPLYGGEMGRFKSFVERAKIKHPHLPKDVVDNLCLFYGSRMDEVLATAYERPGESEELLRRLSPDLPILAVQIVHAMRHEMASHLSDVIFRRTGIGTLGSPGVPMINKIAELMARELRWDETRIAQEIVEAHRFFEAASVTLPENIHAAAMAQAPGKTGL